VAHVIAVRRWRVATEQRIRFEAEFPAPTPRTRASGWGMTLWDRFIDAEHRERHRPDYRTYAERFALVAPGFQIVFDHKIWAKWGEVCWYSPEECRAYRFDDLPITVVQPRTQPEDEVLIREFDVYR
jgi:hypothetical protein